MSTFKKNAAANVGQAVGSAIFLFCLYRQISNSLGLASLGIWSVFVAVNSISRLTDFGISLSVTRFVALFSAQGNSKRAAEVIETSFITVALVVPILIGSLLPLVYKVVPSFFSAEQLVIVYRLIPITGLVIWVNMLATISTGAIDGRGELSWRACLVTGTQFVSTMLAILLLPRFGLFGVSISQLLQGLILVAFSWIYLVRHLSQLSKFPKQFSKGMLKDILSYSLNVQFSSMASLLFDPLTKILFLKFGGAEITAYFEIANQIVMRVRSLLVMANQSIIPKITEMWELQPQKLSLFYDRNLKMLYFISAPVFTLLLVFSKVFASYFSIVNKDLFLIFINCSVISWFLNTISAPGYFINIATGHVASNSAAHFIMALVNIGGGIILGVWWGPIGVMTAYSGALIWGSMFTIGTVHRKLQLNKVNLGGARWSLCVYMLAVAFVNYINVTSPEVRLLDYRSIIPIIVALFAVLIGTWFNPTRSDFFQLISPKLGR